MTWSSNIRDIIFENLCDHYFDVTTEEDDGYRPELSQVNILGPVSRDMTCALLGCKSRIKKHSFYVTDIVFCLLRCVLLHLNLDDQGGMRTWGRGILGISFLFDLFVHNLCFRSERQEWSLVQWLVLRLFLLFWSLISFGFLFLCPLHYSTLLID